MPVLHGTIGRETEKAIQFTYEVAGTPFTTWFPLSQVKVITRSTLQEQDALQVSDWILEKKETEFSALQESAME